jgi:hypothetical protein
MGKMGKMNKRTKSKTMKQKKQKLWVMKGCSKTKRGGCWGLGKTKKYRGGNPKCSKCAANCRCGPRCNCKHKCPGNCYLNKQHGGNCGGTCGLQMGGSVQAGGCQSCLTGGVQLQSGGGSASASPLVGAPWTPKIADWPGVAGKDGQTNYYSLNQYKVDPQTSMTSERDQQTFMKGGKGTKTRRIRGGGIIPQDLVNLGRSMVYAVGSAYNNLNGYAPTANPLPYKGQFPNSQSVKGLV